MFKKLFILCLLVTSLFGGVRELTDENFKRATNRGLVVVEFWATWNEKNKVVLLDEWDTFDAKVYRVNIDLYPKIQAKNDVVILPTIIFYDEGEEVKRLQGDMSFSLKTSIKEFENIKDGELLRQKYDVAMKLAEFQYTSSDRIANRELEVVREFLQENGFYFNEIHFTHDKWSIDVDVLIDDSPSKLKKFKDRSVAGGLPVCMKTTWNSELHEEMMSIDRLSDLVGRCFG